MYGYQRTPFGAAVFFPPWVLGSNSGHQVCMASAFTEWTKHFKSCCCCCFFFLLRTSANLATWVKTWFWKEFRGFLGAHSLPDVRFLVLTLLADPVDKRGHTLSILSTRPKLWCATHHTQECLGQDAQPSSALGENLRDPLLQGLP